MRSKVARHATSSSLFLAVPRNLSETIGWSELEATGLAKVHAGECFNTSRESRHHKGGLRHVGRNQKPDLAVSTIGRPQSGLPLYTERTKTCGPYPGGLIQTHRQMARKLQGANCAVAQTTGLFPFNPPTNGGDGGFDHGKNHEASVTVTPATSCLQFLALEPSPQRRHSVDSQRSRCRQLLATGVSRPLSRKLTRARAKKETFGQSTQHVGSFFVHRAQKLPQNGQTNSWLLLAFLSSCDYQPKRWTRAPLRQMPPKPSGPFSSPFRPLSPPTRNPQLPRAAGRSAASEKGRRARQAEAWDSHRRNRLILKRTPLESRAAAVFSHWKKGKPQLAIQDPRKGFLAL